MVTKLHVASDIMFAVITTLCALLPSASGWSSKMLIVMSGISWFCAVFVALNYIEDRARL